MSADANTWPALPFEEWKDTYDTVHRWMQIVGKIRLRQMPWTNHSWHVTLNPTSHGFTTSRMPYGDRTFQIDFDFLDHRLFILASSGERAAVVLTARSVASFYAELMGKLEELRLPVRISTKPNEVEDATPLDEDEAHRAYDPEYACRCWRIVSRAACVLERFRARFIGKSSPVHFFWGSFDLAVTRFSGGRAPPHPGGIPNLPNWVVREAYSHEVSSCGFWPGGNAAPFPLFYAYAYPEPEGYSSAPVKPVAAAYHAGLREHVLPYDEMRRAGSPESALLEFAQSTYEAAAELGGWDRAALERQEDVELSGRKRPMETTPPGLYPH
jgi:hypothetical protein